MPSQRVRKPDVLVIGGGVAGLSAAVDLVSHDRTLLLVEQKSRCGGRTYSFVDDVTGDEVDNGQHLMMGCYRSSLSYLEKIGSLSRVTVQKRLSVTYRDEHLGPISLRSIPLPGSLGTAAGLLFLKSLSISERLSLLRVGFALLAEGKSDRERVDSLTVKEWLQRHGQSESARRNFWDIICIGALNESSERASASLFAKVLREIFLGSSLDSSMVIPGAGLSSVLVDPAVRFIESRRGSVLLNTSVESLIVGEDGITGAILSDKTRVLPRAVVSAIPYFDLPKMFDRKDRTKLPAIESAGRFISSPILSVHLWFDRPFVEEEFVGFLGSPIHWVFNKSKILKKESEGRQYLCLVVSSAGEFVGKGKGEIVELSLRELRRFYPRSKECRVVRSLVIKEKRATFSPRPGVNAFRPCNRTGIANFFLAGDWTDTGLPATIEGAIRSGDACGGLAREYLA